LKTANGPSKSSGNGLKKLSAFPANRLLIFDVKEGWAPLCRFLDVPVPDTPFPHVNDQVVMLKRFRTMRMVSPWGPVAAVGLIILGVYGVLSLAG
jgi:hypothetical protein